MPSFTPLLKSLESGISKTALGRVARSILKPAIPELAERGTAEAPTILKRAFENEPPVTQRGKNVPFAGVPSLQEATRATEHPGPTIEEIIHKMKVVTGSFTKADPDLPKDIQEGIFTGKWRSEGARSRADLKLQDVYKSLQHLSEEEKVSKSTLMMDYLTTADEVAQAYRHRKPMIAGEPIDVWEKQLQNLESSIEPHADIKEAMRARRELWDTVFDDMTARGWLSPDRYLEDWTPIRKLMATAEGLAEMSGQDVKSRFLPAMRERTGKEGLRETNIIPLEKEVLGDYLRKVSEDEMFTTWLDDPTINMTQHFKPHDSIPRNLAVWNPGPGMMGYQRKIADQSMADGMLAELKLSDNIFTPGAYVFPRPLVHALKRFHGPAGTQGHGLENSIFKRGRTIAKWLTVYFPGNTRMNQVSDIAFAAFGGEPGAKAQPLGIFHWANKIGVPTYKKAFGKNANTIVEINGQKIDFWDMAQNEGLTDATIHHSVGAGRRLSDDLTNLLPKEERQSIPPALDMMQRDRLAVEVIPRIAAGLEAFERTGNLSEFGRVGRDITFRYGAGAPLLSKLPAVRMVAPFLQFAGLASERVMAQLAATGSRGRALAGIMAVPMITDQWNNQNDEYKEVENSLAEYERDQAHIIVPNLSDPSKVRRDITGKPVVLRFRYWVPEEVMKMVGLGNLPSRVRRVKEGRDSPMEFAASIPEHAAEGFTDMMVAPRLISDVVTGKTETGRKLSASERVLRALPVARIPVEGIKGVQDYGLAQGVKQAATEATGIRFSSVARRGSAVMDSDLQTAKRNRFKAKAAYQAAIRDEAPPSKVKDKERLFNEAQDKLVRILDAIEKERKNGK